MYDVRNNSNGKITRSFESLEDAVKFCNGKKTSFGHRITRTEAGRLVTYYDTAEKSQKNRKAPRKAEWGCEN